MEKIVPHLWFNNQAEEAVELYKSIFNNSKISNVSYYEDAGADVSGMKSGSIMSIDFEIEGQEFIALNGGPIFTFTPAISFFINCSTKEELEFIWQKLSKEGSVLMDLSEYNFSKYFGWLQDKFGVNWQLNLGDVSQKINTFFMFTGDNYGKAEEAMKFYTSIFENSTIREIHRYEEGDKSLEGKVNKTIFSLNDQDFMIIDSNFNHNFTFTEAISLFVKCEDQAEVDKLWERLTEAGEEIQCGWLKDKYGISWQIVPEGLQQLLNSDNPLKSNRVMEEMFKMKKIEISKLQQVYDNME
jgi:predicted 3-demethylubiquinone-9 3-methyltransferase (glyoxalase superfamily)